MSFALSTDDVESRSLGLGAVFAQPATPSAPRVSQHDSRGVPLRQARARGAQTRGHLDVRGDDVGRVPRASDTASFSASYVVLAPPSGAARTATPYVQSSPVIRFWVNHHLLNVVERPLWRVVKGRSKAYVDAVVAALPEGSARLRTAVVAAERLAKGGVELTFNETRARPVKTATKKKETFDDVIFACHSDQTLAILGGLRRNQRTRGWKSRDQIPAQRGVPPLGPVADAAREDARGAIVELPEGISRHVRRRRLGVRVVLGEPPSKSAGGRPGSA